MVDSISNQMSKRRVNLTLSSGVLDYADQIINLRRFNNLVELVEQLLREEYERRHGPMLLRDKPSSDPMDEEAKGVFDVAVEKVHASTSTPHTPKTATTYKAARPSKKKPHA